MKSLVPLVATVAVAASALANTVCAQQYTEGQDYFKLPVPVETRNPEKIEVVEVFSYGCIHCYQLEPDLTAWLAVQGDDVDFHRVPMATRNLRTLAQAFFTAQEMGVLDKVHMPMFESIHEYAIDMSRPQLIRRMFVKEAGVDEEEFARIFDSFAINTRVRQADAQTRLYRVHGTPTLIVDGRYHVDTVSAGTADRMLAVARHLIEAERAARASRAAKGTEAAEESASAAPPSS